MSSAAAPRSTSNYENVDLTRSATFYELRGIRLAGRATGRNLLEWPLGRFRRSHGRRHRSR